MPPKFEQFNAKILRGLNDMLQRLEKLENMRGDSFVNIQRSSAGTTIGLNLIEARRRIAKKGGGGGGASSSSTSIKIATCTEDAQSGDEIEVTLNSSVSPTGEAITVRCNISNGSDLNEATPRLEIGDDILVAKVTYWDWIGVAQGEPTPAPRERWYCLTNFQTTEDCTCGT